MTSKLSYSIITITMKVLKGCVLALLSFILFFSLVVFGIAYAVNQRPLNPHYIVKVINDIDFSQVIQETIDEQVSSGDISPELRTTLIDTLKKMEPAIKERVAVAIEDTYAYLKEKKDTPNLKETLSKSVMNSEFVADVLDAVDLSQLVDQFMQEQTDTVEDFSDALIDALITTTDRLEPSLKTQIAAASDPIFKYLLMKTSTIDLKTTLRQTILSDSFISEVIHGLEIKTMIKDILTEHIGTAQLPEGITLSDQQIDRVVTSLEPSVKTDLTNAAGTIADYLAGTRSNFSVITSLTPAMPTLKTVVREAFMEQLPAELQGLPQTEIDDAFEEYFTDFSQTLPIAFELSSSDFGIGISEEISEAITEAQDGLTEARNSIDEASRDFEDGLKEAQTYVGYFRTGFICVIALIVLVIAGIILIHRNVKDICRDMGIVFLFYGATEFAGVLIGKNIALQKIAEINDIPQSLSYLPGKLLNDVISPLQTVGLVCLVGGVLLIVAYFVYPRLRPAKTE